MENIGHYINGKRVDGTSGRTTDVYNPATGEVQAKLALANSSELDAAIAVKAPSCNGSHQCGYYFKGTG